MLLHVSRGVRWDSDHVVTFNDDLQAIADEIVRNDALERIHIGLDYFDASINRVAAWTIGARNTLRALLVALLEPTEMLKQYEIEGDFSSRLALQEELKSMPFSAVWDYYCSKKDVPVGMGFMRCHQGLREDRNWRSAKMPTVKLYANLRKLAGTKELSIPGATVGEVLGRPGQAAPPLGSAPSGW